MTAIAQAPLKPRKQPVQARSETTVLAIHEASIQVLLSVGYRTDAGAPIFADHPVGSPAVDPVVQALVLTDIVIGATVSALLLALALQVHKRKGTLDPHRLRPLRP